MVHCCIMKSRKPQYANNVKPYLSLLIPIHPTCCSYNSPTLHCDRVGNLVSRKKKIIADRGTYISRMYRKS